MKALIGQLKAARACSTPLLAITTPDQPAVAQAIVDNLNGTTPVISWDRTNGFLARNKHGREALQAFCAKTDIGAEELPLATCEPHNAFRHAVNIPAHTIIVAFSLNRFLREEKAGETMQAILNLRDQFKSDQRTIIGLSPDFTLPVEVQHDFILLDDPLPSDEEYSSIVKDLHDSSDIKVPKGDAVNQAVRSVRGLSAFEAEQVLAMAIASTGMESLDLTQAWQLKVGAVGKVKGLTMTLDGPELKNLRGMDNAIRILNGLWEGPMPPELIVRVDEMDKSFGGLNQGGDNNGIMQDMHQQFLTSMNDNGWQGAILFGVRGGGKTVLSESIGKAHGIPTISMDTGRFRGGIVGQSESAVRDAFRTIKGIGGKRVLVLATCNRMDNFSDELLRRFKLGVIYFDLLSAEERAALWPIYLKIYGQSLDAQLPNDTDWTGAEIRNCCELSYMLRRSVEDVGSTMIIPYTKSNPKALETLRATAEGKYTSAAYPGAYRRPVAEVAEVSGRTMKRS